jgi:hypothetical protein
MDAQFRKTKKMRILEKIFGEPIDGLLRKLYVEEDLRLKQICEIFIEKGVHLTPGPLSQWLARLNIPSRTWGFQTGENYEKRRESKQAVPAEKLPRERTPLP